MIVALFGLAPTASAGDRVALILAVEDYESYAKSAIATETVKKIGTGLEDQGFSVDVVTNANNAVVRATLRDFAQKSQGARVAIIVLAGHGVGSSGRTYLLPSNAEIRRASDLLSRGVAVASVAQIAARAQQGAVFFFMTAPDISSTVQGVSSRPTLETVPNDNTFVVFSTSDKVPVSRVGSVSRQAAADFADAASETPLMMATLVGSAAVGDLGTLIGKVQDIDLSAAPAPVAAPVAPPAEPSLEEIAARREAEDRAKDAEKRASAAEARARDAEARARIEAQRAVEAQQSAADTAAAAAADKAALETAAAPIEAAPAKGANSDDANVDALKVVEALLGRSRKKDLQRQMKKLGFYDGPLDAIFGDLTRQGIRDYQAASGEAATGYLTPKQIQALIEG